MSDRFFTGTETCFVDLTANGLNPSFFPVGTAQHLDLNYNILPFLCDLLNNAATNDNVSPVLTQPPTPFDLTPYTDFTGLTAIGDPRVSLGETMTQTYINFLPRVITQTEVRQAGGTQIIDNFICTADGTPIKQSETVTAMISMDLTGQKPYQYGAITVPPISATYDQLMRIISAEEVKNFVVEYIRTARARHAQDFANFIKTYFAAWTVKELNLYESLQYLIVVLEKGTNKTYLKYYSDVANEVGCYLGLTRYTKYFTFNTPDNMKESMAAAAVIPNYKDLMNNPQKAQAFYEFVINNYVSTPQESYTNLLANSATAIQYFNTYAAQASAVRLSAIDIFKC